MLDIAPHERPQIDHPSRAFDILCGVNIELLNAARRDPVFKNINEVRLDVLGIGMDMRPACRWLSEERQFRANGLHIR